MLIPEDNIYSVETKRNPLNVVGEYFEIVNILSSLNIYTIVFRNTKLDLA